MGQLPLMKGKGLGLTVAALAFGLKGICSNMIHLGLAGHVKPGHGQPGGGCSRGPLARREPGSELLLLPGTEVCCAHCFPRSQIFPSLAEVCLHGRVRECALPGGPGPGQLCPSPPPLALTQALFSGLPEVRSAASLSL